MRFLSVLLLSSCLAAVDSVPLLFSSDGESLTSDGKLKDFSPHGYHAELGGALVEGRMGKAVAGGEGLGLAVQGDLLKNLGQTFTATAWIRVEALPAAGGLHWLLGKGGNTGWQIGIQENGQLWHHGSWGGGWYHGPFSDVKVPLATWIHVAGSFAKGGTSVVYIDGRAVLGAGTPFAIQPVGDAFQFGHCSWRGAIDDPRIYAAALTPEQIVADRDGVLVTRAATTADLPMPLWPARIRLGRFDRPIPNIGFVYPGHEPARRVGPPDAVDWPRLRHSEGGTLFADPTASEATDVIETKLRDGGSLFRQPGDLLIEPIGHWLRPINWLWGQQHIYTSDRTARSWGGDYELWGFPLRIAGSSPGAVRDVVLRVGAEELYHRAEKLDSLTLILPASGALAYSLSVNGLPAQTLQVGLKPIVVGAPVDEVVPVRLEFLLVRADLPAPHAFSQGKAWDEDVAALTQPGTPADAAYAVEAQRDPLAAARLRTAIQAVPPLTGPQRHVNAEVTRSGVDVFISALSAGMSGGQKTAAHHITYFDGDDTAYAKHLAALGFDRVFETVDITRKPLEIALWQANFRAHGVRFGANLAGYSHEAQLGNPNIAFYAATLPDWGGNLLRDLQLAAQLVGGAQGGGFFMGADNAGYVPYWDWAPPIPNRPWARAFLGFQEGQTTHPIGPACGNPKDYERRGTQREFIEYIRRYDRTWNSYGRFAAAIAEISPEVPFTIGSFGSAPGVGAHCGWPWASVPAGPIFDQFDVQTAYDWNEVAGTKTLHNLVLVDRLHSTAPQRRTWSIVDDFGLCRGPEVLLRDWAVSLSRGLNGIGTNFLAHTTGADAASELRRRQVAGYSAASAWAHRYGGAYAQMRADATVGIVFSDHQAISRHLSTKDPEGPHEGKTSEAMILCTMAGWPARLVTVDELARGVDPSLKALMLVGLNRFDDTWVWHQGLESRLQEFTARGGRILRDHESVCPVDSSATELQIASYVVQGTPDQLPVLQERNRPLVAQLAKHLLGIPRAATTCADDRVWIFPSRAGDCRFVTVGNFAPAIDTTLSPDVKRPTIQNFKNAASEVAPLKPLLAWEKGAIAWDLATAQALDLSAPLDLASTAVRLLVIPTQPPTAPRLRLEAGALLRIDIAGCAGLPVEVSVRGPGGEATVWGAAGQALALPLTIADPGEWIITCRELASGKTATLRFQQPVAPVTPAAVTRVRRQGTRGIAAFASRKDRELVIALTAAQAADPDMQALAERIRVHYAKAGRTVRIGRADPSDIILYQQPIQSLMSYPRWYTIDADLVLFGCQQDNVLLLDQARGNLLTEGLLSDSSLSLDSRPALIHTYSPFRGLCNVVNVLGNNPSELTQGVDALLH